MLYAAARSSRQLEPQILDPCNTASGFTVLTRMRSDPPSSARHRARCSSAAFAEEYALAFLPAAIAFLEATKIRLPPLPCSLMRRKASRETRKYPFARTAWFLSHISTLVSSMGALEARPALETTTSTPPYSRTACL